MPGISNIKIPLIGICTAPEIQLEDNGKVFFAPTSLGICSKKLVTISNLSKTRTFYKLLIP
jgi:hypothetical protein